MQCIRVYWGGYDDVLEPEYISEQCDYFIVSDRKPSETSVYQYIDVKDVLPDIELDVTRKNRYIKLHPHLIFPNYRYSVYMDGNIILKDDIAACISKIGTTGLATIRRYPYDTYSEAIQMMNNGVGEPELIYKQMEQYYYEGFPINFGHWLNTILIREHNNPRCRKIMNDWWQEIVTKSRRDQLSLPYVIWKNGYEINDVGVISETLSTAYTKDCIYFDALTEHNIDRKKYEYMFLK